MTTPARVDELFAEAVRERGDVYDEVRTILRVDPRVSELIRACAGYVHGYPGQTEPTQVLSPILRELIALAQLCAMRDDRFAPSHVRRLYRLGVADDVIIAAAEAIAPAVGHSTILHVALAIETARDADHPFGALPADGPPESSVDFRERHRWSSQQPVDAPAWTRVGDRDPTLAARFRAFDDHCLGRTEESDSVLGAGARLLIVIPALAARGLADAVARHVTTARGLGICDDEVVEAVSCVLPMTGGATMEACLDALERADAH